MRFRHHPPEIDSPGAAAMVFENRDHTPCTLPLKALASVAEPTLAGYTRLAAGGAGLGNEILAELVAPGLYVPEAVRVAGMEDPLSENVRLILLASVLPPSFAIKTRFCAGDPFGEVSSSARSCG